MTKELEGKARDQLFEDLFCGQLTPQQAEARAQECGLQPLKPKLDPALYDPMEEPDWTLAMARAWIAWGELDLVREVSPRWRQDSHIWHLRKFREPNKKGGWTERTGWSLEQVHKQKPSLQLALLDARQAGETGLSKSSMRAMIPSAQAELWRRLRDDDLSATVSADGMVSKIPAREWAYLELTDFHGEDFLAVRSGNSLSRKYLARDVLIASLDLMGLWRHEPRPTAEQLTVQVPPPLPAPHP